MLLVEVLEVSEIGFLKDVGARVTITRSLKMIDIREKSRAYAQTEAHFL
ncbi:hypothetical protein [Bradyrhizobium sp. CCBAU 11430]|nr:hypothetical protein [Bradyrhizobium sp. CCBAU 11430]